MSEHFCDGLLGYLFEFFFAWRGIESLHSMLLEDFVHPVLQILVTQERKNVECCKPVFRKL